MPTATIFDVGGILVDAVGVHAKGWQDASRDCGRNVFYRNPADLLARLARSPLTREPAT